ncbi:uncharacterized protein LOC105772261 [Gossypium raimondii]|uniref:Uncharacterized protein n=2 Tax=Gossypium raimondii TaxID=29730 RepID=A0A0D2RDQ9_GOSRA|nr:uncharacterized protein LOC105772261 [Gossypium raimondii]KJB68642.1 hypothetical protein B456_010G255900 [Gossypium raimondii]
MAGVGTRILWDHRNLMSHQVFKLPENPDSDSSGMEFSFLEDGDDGDQIVGIHNDGDEDGDDDDDDDERKESDGSGGENKEEFWEIQHQVLEATVCRISSLESRIRIAIKEALRDIKRETTTVVCGCGGKSMAEGCRVCFMREVFRRLQTAGFNTAICRSKWRSTSHIPSGEHSFLDVIENSSKGDVRVIIELNFRAEFEMARASEDYNRLVRRLPEVFVGKVERLNDVIKILCLAAKKCMKEKKMHMGPWRKQSYMQAKWLKPCERNTSTRSLPVGDSGRLPKPRASMLTVDLLENFSDVCCTAVEVV